MDAVRALLENQTPQELLEALVTALTDSDGILDLMQTRNSSHKVSANLIVADTICKYVNSPDYDEAHPKQKWSKPSMSIAVSSLPDDHPF